MNGMRTAAATLLLACLLTACQSNGNAPKTAQSNTASGAWLDTATYDDYKVTEPMKAPLVDTMTDLTHQLLTKCIDATGPGKMEACYRERLLAGYDTGGTAEAHCPAEADLEQQYMCIVIGSYVGEFIRMMDLANPPQMDWSDPEKPMQTAAMAFMTRSMGKCLGGSSASDATQCLLNVMAKQLGLLESDVEPCRVLDDDTEFGQCIGEAYSMIFIREGLARM